MKDGKLAGIDLASLPRAPLLALGGLGLLILMKAGLHKGSNWKSHHHDALEHGHEHVHVTHNQTDGNKAEGGWQHLTSGHSHFHNHAGVEHSHRPHRDIEDEHRGEAHIHDHGNPTG